MCGEYHEVPNRKYRYCPRHTMAERKAYIQRRLRSDPVEKGRLREEKRRWRAKRKAQDPEGWKAHYENLRRNYDKRPWRAARHSEDDHPTGRGISTERMRV